MDLSTVIGIVLIMVLLLGAMTMSVLDKASSK